MNIIIYNLTVKRRREIFIRGEDFYMDELTIRCPTVITFKSAHLSTSHIPPVDMPKNDSARLNVLSSNVSRTR